MADVSLTQWLALTPPEIVATTLKIPITVVEGLKKEKQLLSKARGEMLGKAWCAGLVGKGGS